MSEQINVMSVLVGDTLETHPLGRPEEIVEVVVAEKIKRSSGIKLGFYNPKHADRGVTPRLCHPRASVTLISRISDDGEVVYY